VVLVPTLVAVALGVTSMIPLLLSLLVHIPSLSAQVVLLTTTDKILFSPPLRLLEEDVGVRGSVVLLLMSEVREVELLLVQLFRTVQQEQQDRVMLVDKVVTTMQVAVVVEALVLLVETRQEVLMQATVVLVLPTIFQGLLIIMQVAVVEGLSEAQALVDRVVVGGSKLQASRILVAVVVVQTIWEGVGLLAVQELLSLDTLRRILGSVQVEQ
jgi:hypothetical protein